MKSIIGLVLGGLVLLVGIVVGFSAVNIIDDGERGMVSCLNILVAPFPFLIFVELEIFEQKG